MLSRLLLPTKVTTLLVAVMAFGFALASVRVGFWTVDGPGPGVVLRERAAPEEPFRAIPIAGIAIGCAYAAVLPYAGFALPTVLLVVIWARVFYRQSWTRAAALGLALTLVSAVLFGKLLKVPLPLVPGWS